MEYVKDKEFFLFHHSNTPTLHHSIDPPCRIRTRPFCSSPSAAQLALKKFAPFSPA